ncbi:MAG: DMT family transporter [Sphaerochaetaceae bacterium]|jgi:transporter family-2 protein
MHNFGNYLVALSIGSLISVMVVLNTILGQETSMALSFIINHLIGIVVITLILIVLRFTKGKPTRQKAPWYLYGGGIFGFLILNSNYITIINIGASLSMATAVFGQSLGSLLFDLFGFMGAKTYKLNKRKVILLAISLIGIIIMSLGGGAYSILYIIIGIATGVITMIQMVYNAKLARLKGNLFSARNNVLSGLIVALIVYLFFSPSDIINSAANLPKLSFSIIYGGGLLAILVVVGSNFVIGRIPTLYNALLLSSAQILTSVVLDFLMFDIFSTTLLVGSLIVLLGTAGSIIVEEVKES